MFEKIGLKFSEPISWFVILKIATESAMPDLWYLIKKIRDTLIVIVYCKDWGRYLFINVQIKVIINKTLNAKFWSAIPMFNVLSHGIRIYDYYGY